MEKISDTLSMDTQLELEASVPLSFNIDPLKCVVQHLPVKRSFDIFFSLSVLILGAPLFLLLMLFIRASSPGKVVYSHKRVGRGGKFFQCYKFRTMFSDADDRLKKILAKDANLKKEWEATFKLKNDPRVTKIGAFLRKTSLDELPQFWNVLKGDLSVVGPRPVIEEELKKFFGEKSHRILSIRPGLTGLWQISGRTNTTYQKRILLDEEYIEKKSLWFDLKLIGKTVPVMLFKKGAY